MYLFGLPDENHIVSIFLLSFICWVQNRLWVRKKQANRKICSPVSFFAMVSAELLSVSGCRWSAVSEQGVPIP